MGPAYCGLHALTFLRNLSIPMGVKGTPKSGQLVKWNWVTSLWGFFPDTSPTYRQRNERGERFWINGMYAVSEITHDSNSPHYRDRFKKFKIHPLFRDIFTTPTQKQMKEILIIWLRLLKIQPHIPPAILYKGGNMDHRVIINYLE